MEARTRRPWLGLAALIVCAFSSQFTLAQFGNQGSVAHSQNFIVFAATPQLAKEVSDSAERLRRDLALHWLGYELNSWSSRCPIHVTSAKNLGAGGETRFTLAGGVVGNWMMSVQGTRERILDSVLPHEITHTLFASHFAALNKHVPRWADEGACTTVEHESEQAKHKHMLQQFLKQGRGLTFNRMFSLKDYPHDILPLYAQGHAVVEFLIAQGGPRKFVQFLEIGMKTGQWEPAVRTAYGYATLGELKVKWNEWLADGRGDVALYAANPIPKNNALASSGTVSSVSGEVPRRSPAQLASSPVGVPRAPMIGQPEGPAVLLAANAPASGLRRIGEQHTPAISPVNLAAEPASIGGNSGAMSSSKNGLVASGGRESWYALQLENGLREIDRSNQPSQETTTASPQQVASAGLEPSLPYQPYIGSHTASRPQPMQQVQPQVLQWSNLR